MAYNSRRGLSAAAQGAGTGAMIGGPWGAAIGGGVGLLTGFFGGGDEDGDPYGGMPTPTYTGFDTETPRKAYAALNLNIDPSAARALSEAATRGGLSPEAVAAKRAQGLFAMKQADDLAKASAGGAATAKSALAMKGGLQGGAAERIQKTGRDTYLLGRQGIFGDAARNKANIEVADLQAKRGLLSPAAGAALSLGTAQYGADKGEIDAMTAIDMAEARQRNAYNMAMYKQDMDRWAAGKQAEATQKSGKK